MAIIWTLWLPAGELRNVQRPWGETSVPVRTHALSGGRSVLSSRAPHHLASSHFSAIQEGKRCMVWVRWSASSFTHVSTHSTSRCIGVPLAGAVRTTATVGLLSQLNRPRLSHHSTPGATVLQGWLMSSQSSAPQPSWVWNLAMHLGFSLCICLHLSGLLCTAQDNKSSIWECYSWSVASFWPSLVSWLHTDVRPFLSDPWGVLCLLPCRALDSGACNAFWDPKDTRVPEAGSDPGTHA